MDNASYASWAAEKAQLTASDAIVLIGWLSERVAALEALIVADYEFGPPELPSKIHGFGCVPRREKAVQDALAKATETRSAETEGFNR